MEKKLVIRYNPAQGYLAMDKGISRYFEQDIEEIEEGILCRTNPETGEIENVDLMYFSAEVPGEERRKMLGRAVELLCGLDSAVIPVAYIA
ncbi:MAG: hypothetical protein ACRC8A_17210 [Microcoleaceae cyanobacterium]